MWDLRATKQTNCMPSFIYFLLNTHTHTHTDTLSRISILVISDGNQQNVSADQSNACQPHTQLAELTLLLALCNAINKRPLNKYINVRQLGRVLH